MKTELTPSESAHLIELGIDPSKASENTEYGAWADSEHGRPIFDLSDILSLVPKEIDGYPLLILAKQFFEQTNEVAEGWTVLYTKNDLSAAFGDESIYSASELIDALYNLLVWCITNENITL